MSLLKRAASRTPSQAPSGRARLAGAVNMLKQRFQPELPASLAGINVALDDLSPLPEKIALLKKETLQREAKALGKILEKAAPFVPCWTTPSPITANPSPFSANRRAFPSTLTAASVLM